MSLMRIAQSRAALEDAAVISGAPEESPASPASPPSEDAVPGATRPAEPSRPRVPTGPEATTALKDQLLGYVPTDALAGYVALTAAFSWADGWWVRALVFGLVTATAPVWIVLAYREAAQTPEALKQWPTFQMVIGTAAFFAWSTSVPESMWQKDLDLPGVAGVAIAVAASFVISLVVRYYAQQHRIPKGLGFEGAS